MKTPARRADAPSRLANYVVARCKPGDLAIVVRSIIPSNLGRIVRVIALHNGEGDLIYPSSEGTIWLVESAQPLTWRWKGRRFRRKSGPAPDYQLQPIRGEGIAKTSTTKRSKVEPIKRKNGVPA